MSIEETFSGVAGSDVRYVKHEFFHAEYFGKSARRLEVEYEVPSVGKKGVVSTICEEPADEIGAARECAYGARDWAAHKIRKAISHDRRPPFGAFAP